LKICVVDFWEDAFEGDFFEYFFRVSLGDYQRVTNPDEADVVIKSVFGNTQTNPKKTIMYIGENVRPSFLGYDYSLSFDYDDYGGRNCRLPLWYSRLEWEGFKYTVRKPNRLHHGYETLIPINKLTSRRDIPEEGIDVRKFCALVANNPEGLRVNLFNTLSQYKQVDGYGNMFGRPLVGSKFEVLPHYKFALCPENSIYEGYVTEKIVDAYAGGCVPLYSGTISVSDEMNSDAFINYRTFNSMDEFVGYVKYVDNNPQIYKAMYSQPLLRHKPSLNHALAFMHNIMIEIRNAK
jgi:hypothetical protein